MTLFLCIAAYFLIKYICNTIAQGIKGINETLGRLEKVIGNHLTHAIYDLTSVVKEDSNNTKEVKDSIEDLKEEVIKRIGGAEK
ncbi:MAG: hypothetical protein ACOWWR_18565 [Eubacteriales bacterium]